MHNSKSFAPLDSPVPMAKHRPAAKDDQKETFEFSRKETIGELTSLCILVLHLF